MRRLLDFLFNMDARVWRAIAVTVGLFATIALMLFFGKTALGLDAAHRLEAWMGGFSDSPLGLLIAVVVFTLAAFVGAPQFLLIAACVVAFGPFLGFVYSWVATVVSAAATYYVGRFGGAKTFERFAGSTLNRMSRFVGRNAFYASFIIRNVPSAPFIVVNMAFGVARAPVWSFLAGCALGVLPKTALVALFGGGFMTAVAGDGVWTSLILIGVGFAWLALMLVARRLLRNREKLAEGETR